jgi:hypothetical protein
VPTKIIHLAPYFQNTGELSVQPVVLWANGRPCFEEFTKHAAVSGADIFTGIRPVPGKTIVYVLALGSWEYYGENRNGDGFPERPYMENASPPWIPEDATLIKTYKSFETHAKNYRHHANKDPNKSVGRVIRAVWNDRMHRVELIVELDNAAAPDLAERIEAGEFPPVSMGARVPYDLCNVCGNKAPRRADYCEHAQFQMHQPIGGKIMCVLNPYAKFFDISWVFRPADRTAWMMKKVAEDAPYELSGIEGGEYLDKMSELKEAAKKLAAMDKLIQGTAVDAQSTPTAAIENGCEMAREIARNTPDFPSELLRELAKHPMNKVFSSLMATGGMMLSTPEIIRMAHYKVSPDTEVPEEYLDRAVGLQSSILEFLADNPQAIEQLRDSGPLDMSVDNVDEELVKKAYPYLEKRAGIKEYLHRKLTPEAYRYETPYTTPLTLTDPATGQRYGTTRGAAIAAHDEIAKKNLYKVLGGAAALGGTYKLIGHGLDRASLGKLKPLAALGLGFTGGKFWPSMGEHYMTDQGIPVPTMTEMAKISAANPMRMSELGVPLLGSLGLLAYLGHDYESRMRSGIPLGYEGLPATRRIHDSVSSFAHDHPYLTAGLGVVGGRRLMISPTGQRIAKFTREKILKPLKGMGQDMRDRWRSLDEGKKLAELIPGVVEEPTSTVRLPRVNLDKLAEWLGETIVGHR